MEQTACEVVLVVCSVCTAIGAYQWLSDPQTPQVGLVSSLYNHLFFSVSLLILILLFICGIHKRVVAPSIIASRCRQVLYDFNMACDDFPLMNSEYESVVVGSAQSLANVFIIFGGVIPFFFQYLEIQRSKSARGFSLFVCLTLLSANVLRVIFWVGKRFEWQLLVQSLVMIVCMLVMVVIAVRANANNILPPRKSHSIFDEGDFWEHFWSWTDVTSYMVASSGLSLFVFIISGYLLRVPAYVEFIGFASLMLEANLAMPQLVTNLKRRSTAGMSLRMVGLWTIGDIAKTVYFLVKNTPIQFWACGIFQIGVDIFIIGQVLCYAPSVRVHLKVDSQPI